MGSRKVELARMNYKEVDAIDRRRSVVLLPVGALEQHGPAGVMGTDYILAEHVAVEAASRVEGVYVAPTITYGYSPTFQHYPGNLGLPYDVFVAHLRAVVERLLACGWRNIVYVNAHLGNEPACDQVAREMRAAHGIVMATLSPWRIAMQTSKDLYRDVNAAYGHGAEPTISVMMALFPGAVDERSLVADKNRALPGFEASTTRASVFRGVEVGLYVDAEMLAASGAGADPSEASADKGREALRRSIDYCAAFLPVYRALMNDHFDEHGAFRP